MEVLQLIGIFLDRQITVVLSFLSLIIVNTFQFLEHDVLHLPVDPLNQHGNTKQIEILLKSQKLSLGYQLRCILKLIPVLCAASLLTQYHSVIHCKYDYGNLRRISFRSVSLYQKLKCSRSAVSNMAPHSLQRPHE